MKKFVSLFVSFIVLLFCFVVPCFAEEYSTEFPDLPYPIMPLEDYSDEYPSLFNSGSPMWLHCEIEGMGEYVVVIDPNINPQSFGFDSPDGYGLINNTADTIVGRAYSTRSSSGYMARWLSFYKLQLQTGTTVGGQRTYEDYNITKIYGTTLDLVDYVGNRGNDMYKHDINVRDYRVIICACLVAIVLLFALFMLIKPRLLRM